MTRAAPVSALALLLAVLVALAMRAPPAIGDDAATAWRDPAIVEKRFAEALDAVEKEVGVPFVKRPTVRISTRDEALPLLEQAQDSILEVAGSDVSGTDRKERMSRGLVAAYEESSRIVHVIPDGAEWLAASAGDPALMGEPLLRAILLVQVASALDLERYPLAELQEASLSLGRRMAQNAVRLGHAVGVARRVAASRDLTGALDRYVRAVSEPAATSDPREARGQIAFAATQELLWVEGQRFIDAVRAARGSKGVEEALRNPPERVEFVERPEAWLDPSIGARWPDLGAGMALLTPLVADTAWKTFQSPLLKPMFGTMLSSSPSDAGFLPGVEAAHVLLSRIPAEDAAYMVLLFRYASREQAMAAMEGERRAARLRDEVIHSKPQRPTGSSTFRDGAGPAADVPGFRTVLVISEPGFERQGTVETAVIDAVVVKQTSLNAPGIDGAVADLAVARIRAFLNDPAAAAKLPPLAAPPYQSKFVKLRVHVLDADGKPVPHAKAMRTTPPVEGRTVSAVEDVTDGTVEFTHRRGEVAVNVWGAASADGTPLLLAPQRREHIGADAGEVEFRLAPGTSVSGHVTNPGGKPVVGAEVRAKSSQEEWKGRSEYTSSARTDAYGAFRLDGLEADFVEVYLAPAPDLAASSSVRVMPGSPDVVLFVRPGTTATLAVIDWNDRPVGGAMVYAEVLPMGGPISLPLVDGFTDAEGHVTLVGLVAGAAHHLSVDPPPFTSFMGRDVGRRDDLLPLRRKEWKPANETLRLERAYVVTGVVHDAAGKPVRARVWRKEDPARGEKRDVSMSTRTSASGEFRIAAVPYGPASIGAVPEMSLMREQPAVWVAVTPEDPKVVLVLPPDPGSLYVDGAPAGLQVHFLPEESPGRGDSWWSDLEADGRVSLWRLDPARTYTLWVPPGSLNPDLSLFLPGVRRTEKDQHVSLVKGWIATGRVINAPPDGVVKVAVIGPDATRIRGIVEADGTYSVRGLPPGKWKIEARVRTKATELRVSADVQEGGNVDLEFKPQ